jgi:hypothetical protein
MFAGAKDPAIPPVLTPLTFVMREAVGLPRPARSLPLAFLHMDLQNKAGWKQRITSAERLVREHAITNAILLDLYLEGTASASGGVWERVKTVQALNNTLDAGDDKALSESLIKAYRALAPLGLQPVLADWFSPALKDHTLTSAAKHIGFELAALNGDSRELALNLASSDQKEHFIASILSNRYDAPPKGDLQQAISNALTGLSPKTVLHQSVDDGRRGEAVLKALTLLHSGPNSDVGDVETALSVLAYSGFKDEAKNIAIQLLLLGKSQ